MLLRVTGARAVALRFTLPSAGGSYVAPANHCVGSAPPFPPFGLRVRLRADFDETPYAAPTRVLLRAVKRHGMIFADQGAPWTVGGTNHPGFEAVLRDLRERPNPRERVRGPAHRGGHGLLSADAAAPVAADEARPACYGPGRAGRGRIRPRRSS